MVNLPSACFCGGSNPLPYLPLVDLLDQAKKLHAEGKAEVSRKGQLIGKTVEIWKFQDENLVINVAFLINNVSTPTDSQTTYLPFLINVRHNGMFYHMH